MPIDPRWFQVCALGALLCASIGWLDMAATQGQAAVMLAAALGTQALACAATRTRFDPLSPLITGLSLSVLLRTHDPALWLGAPILAIGSKALLRVRGKHVFNPAAFAIVVLLGAGANVWVSPGQWGTQAWVAAALLCAGTLVLGRARRAGMAAAFLGCYAGLLVARAWWLGDPWAIPLHQMQTGSLLIFACFMVTDPRTAPDHPLGRAAFVACVAGLGFWLQFGWQLRTGLYWALAVTALFTPLLDALLPAARFGWRRPKQPDLGVA